MSCTFRLFEAMMIAEDEYDFVLIYNKAIINKRRMYQYNSMVSQKCEVTIIDYIEYIVQYRKILLHELKLNR